MLADQAIRLGDAQLVIAGGMENMSRPPYLLLKAREGYRMGNGELPDALIYDGLTDAFSNKHMGCFADQCAAKYGITKQQQDDFAVRSHTRARKAIEEGIFGRRDRAGRDHREGQDHQRSLSTRDRASSTRRSCAA